MKIILAQPQHLDHVSKFYRRVCGADVPREELLSKQRTAELHRAGELAVVIAAHQKTIIGCGLGWPQPWNDSLEIGEITVDPQVPERPKIAKALFQAVQRLGIKEYGLVYFHAANKREFRRVKKLGARCWGYRPGANSVKINDAELIMGFLDVSSERRRVEPPVNAITRLPFAARIISSYTNSERGIPHPKNYPVGCPQGTGATMISGRVWPTYFSRGNYISIENAAGAYPVEIIKEFKAKVRKKGVSDLRLTLPVNQEEAFFELLHAGFRPLAYLPGWFERGVHRFDCVKLISGGPSIPRKPATFMENAVSRIHGELQTD